MFKQVLITHKGCRILAHLKLIKTEEAGFIAYLHGNRRYGVIGEHFPQASFWEALFPLMYPFKQHTNVRHKLKNTCTGKTHSQDNTERSNTFISTHNSGQLAGAHQDKQR